MKTNKSSVRSKRMIQNAFLELLQEKPIDKISVSEVARRADIARNTFYAHYQDVRSVQTDLQDLAVKKICELASDCFEKPNSGGITAFLNTCSAHMAEHRNTVRALVMSDASFLNRLRVAVTDTILDNNRKLRKYEEHGFTVFVELMVTGYIGLLMLYLGEDSNITEEDLVGEADRICKACLPLYII